MSEEQKQRLKKLTKDQLVDIIVSLGVDIGGVLPERKTRSKIKGDCGDKISDIIMALREVYPGNFPPGKAGLDAARAAAWKMRNFCNDTGRSDEIKSLLEKKKISQDVIDYILSNVELVKQKRGIKTEGEQKQIGTGCSINYFQFASKLKKKYPDLSWNEAKATASKIKLMCQKDPSIDGYIVRFMGEDDYLFPTEFDEPSAEEQGAILETKEKVYQEQPIQEVVVEQPIQVQPIQVEVKQRAPRQESKQKIPVRAMPVRAMPVRIGSTATFKPLIPGLGQVDVPEAVNIFASQDPDIFT